MTEADTTRWKIGRMASGQWRFCLVSGSGIPIIRWQYRGTKEACEVDITLIRAEIHIAPIEYNAVSY